mmetsp:Transcript_22572/g.67629  ORF Transcript_22572/g.67629 Transcript_22572/m.67629 type:complete len:228 (+) Transcript_22572:690-1373(+)
MENSRLRAASKRVRVSMSHGPGDATAPRSRRRPQVLPALAARSASRRLASSAIWSTSRPTPLWSASKNLTFCGVAAPPRHASRSAPKNVCRGVAVCFGGVCSTTVSAPALWTACDVSGAAPTAWMTAPGGPTCCCGVAAPSLCATDDAVRGAGAPPTSTPARNLSEMSSSSAESSLAPVHVSSSAATTSMVTSGESMTARSRSVCGLMVCFHLKRTVARRRIASVSS